MHHAVATKRSVNTTEGITGQGTSAACAECCGDLDMKGGSLTSTASSIGSISVELSRVDVGITAIFWWSDERCARAELHSDVHVVHRCSVSRIDQWLLATEQSWLHL
jgi:hypothetical protein